MLKKIWLKIQLRKFYKIFAEELDRTPFTIKIRDFKFDGFILDVRFDINEILEAYENTFCSEAYRLHSWLTKLDEELKGV